MMVVQGYILPDVDSISQDSSEALYIGSSYLE